MTKVLIVGATGLVGSNLVMACKEQNKEVRALVRTESIANPEKIDPLKTAGVEIAIVSNVITQEGLIQLWEEITCKFVKRAHFSLEDLEEIMAASNTPDTLINLVLSQLKRSAWIRGDGGKVSDIALDAAELYPDIKITTISEALTQHTKGS
jgi:NAD dependent epimerase/dehydratase family enzyme